MGNRRRKKDGAEGCIGLSGQKKLAQKMPMFYYN